MDNLEVISFPLTIVAKDKLAKIYNNCQYFGIRTHDKKQSKGINMCPIQIHIIDTKEDVRLLETIFDIIEINYELTSSNNFSNIYETNPKLIDIVFIGSSVLHSYGDKMLCEIKNDKRFIDIPFIILAESDLCEKYLISRTLPKTQIYTRPLECSKYQELIKQILYKEVFD